MRTSELAVRLSRPEGSRTRSGAPGAHPLAPGRLGGTMANSTRERADGAPRAIEWVRDDMREFRRPAAFDLACNLFSSFGYFEREEDNLQVLRNLRESLRDGGVLVMDMVGRERVMRQGMEERRIQFADGATLIQRPHLSEDGERMDSEWTLVKGGQSRSYRFEHYLYSGQGLRHRLLGAGFAAVTLYGDLQGTPYGADAPRLVAVGQTIA